MDASRLAELRRWAASLERAGAPELRAAGRAIRTLCEENEALARRLDALGSPADDDTDETDEADQRDDDDRDEPAGSRDDQPRGDQSRGDQSRGDQSSLRSRLAGKRLPWRLTLLVLAVAVALTGLVALAAAATRPEIRAGGPADGAVVGATSAARLAVWAEATASEQTWTLDGRTVVPARTGTRLVLQPKGLADGEHTVVIRTGGGLLRSASRTFRFAVDTAAPTLRLDAPATVRPGAPLLLDGTIEPGARALVGTRTVEVGSDGRFEYRSDAPPPARLVLTATDAAGNTSRWRVPVTIVPRRPRQPLRAVHVTAYAWADAGLREGVLDLVRTRRINAVELDLKDESGEIGWNAPVPLARRIGASRKIYDLGAAVRQLHGLGVRVIGRLVCFRDPIHARAAWDAGRRAEVVQTPGGGPYAGYGGFTNVANAAVRRYQIDVAVAAAKLGVDEVLYDYVRRPDGPLSSMRFAGLRGTPEQAIVEFLRESRAALAGTKALVGASVFGVAATRPKEVAQDIPRMARQVDYIAPMVYPSHWAPGEYDVADPNGSPYEITHRSLGDFVRLARGTGARIVPWLQDFSLGRTYGPVEVAAQIRAARDAGADEFLLWDPAVDYTADALATDAGLPALGVTTAAPTDAPGPVRLPDATPKQQQPAAPAARGSGPSSGLPANELGEIPVVMHHMVRGDRVGEYDQTPAEFRAELELLWRRGYAPIRASELAAGRIDVPAGRTPVVMTFDDATRYQLALDARGGIRADTAVGMMLAFAKTHPGFAPAGTFYVNRAPFGGGTEARTLLRWLTTHGFEVGNHTHDHVPLAPLGAAEAQRQLARGARVIEDLLPGYEIATMALPLGSMPKPARLAVRGAWEGTEYGPYAVLLVGASPAPSPFSTAFDRRAIPRIRTSHADWSGAADYAFAYWMRELQRHPARRFVSDGDPERITVPSARLDEVAARFRSRATARR
ncbi:MAG TPA: putative glycoside hydrolase [Gaiellaceae bacterium]|nr:putative glycoside hydrolase [Gaiellaceae bacterium]